MKNEELKKKIAQIISEYCCPSGKTHKQLYGDDRMCYSKMNFEECNPITECADALIAAGIGDVKEAEHRAKVAERALKEAVDRYIGVDCLCHGADDAECKDCNEYCNVKYLEIEEAVPCAMNKFLQQAEKELAEEGNE